VPVVEEDAASSAAGSLVTFFIAPLAFLPDRIKGSIQSIFNNCMFALVRSFNSHIQVSFSHFLQAVYRFVYWLVTFKGCRKKKTKCFRAIKARKPLPDILTATRRS